MSSDCFSFTCFFISSPLYALSSTFSLLLFFFFKHPAPPEIYTLSLHDALPIWDGRVQIVSNTEYPFSDVSCTPGKDRKSTRLNSSHLVISYAVFCLKKKKT